jgi:hypothetical protein
MTNILGNILVCKHTNIKFVLTRNYIKKNIHLVLEENSETNFYWDSFFRGKYNFDCHFSV